jgi:tRNA (adenine37-N6)-methyltransferase
VTRAHAKITAGMASFSMEPIGYVSSLRTDTIDDDWGGMIPRVSLDPDRFTADSVRGLDEFSHLEVAYVLDRVEHGFETGARRPRGDRDWPEVGVFAQRNKRRPNRIAVSTGELVGIDGLELTVRGLDAIDGSPVLDVKPYMIEFAPRTPVRQPAWSHELMSGYW